MVLEGAPYGGSKEYPRLPRGRHGLPRELVEEDQRRRLVVAVAEIAHEDGVLGLFVSEIVRRAHVSRKTFYEFFASREECIGFACAESESYLFDPVRRAAVGSGPWLERVDAGLGAMLEMVAREPQLAELCLMHSPGLGGSGAQRGGIEALVALLREGRAAGLEASGSTAVVEEFVAGAIITAVSARIADDRPETVPGMRRELVQLSVGPFVGVEEAERYAGSGRGRLVT